MMGAILRRKCAKCKKIIEIDVDDIKDVMYFENLYYHDSCFRALVDKRSVNKNALPKWKEILDDDFKQVEKDAYYIVNYYYGRDLLFNHLLSTYDINAVSTYMAKQFDAVIKGEYKGKSKPIEYRDLASCWIEIQPQLNKIYNNKQRFGVNMTDTQRIIYDLAIVVGEYNNWRKSKELLKIKEANRKLEEQKTARIDYTKIKTIENSDGLGDINDLLDEI